MLLRASRRAVLSSGGDYEICPTPIRENGLCVLPIRENGSTRIIIRANGEARIWVRENGTGKVEVSMSGCECVQKIDECIVQSAARTFRFEDISTEDYSGATEITFDVWENGIGGASLLSYSLTGGTISLVNDYTFTLDVTNAESVALPKGRHHCEAWVTLSTGERRCVGLGTLRVIDSRKHD